MRRQFLQIDVAKPCSEDWEEMRGDVRARYCAACEKVVHDLSRMTDRQVGHLAMRAAGGESVCARVTRRANGNLVLLEPERNRPRVAGALLSTLLITGGAAAQNLRGEQTDVARAVLSGTLLRPDGSPFDGGRVLLRTGGSAPVTFPVGMDGHFEATVTPGVYDLALRGNALFGARVNGVTLHQGEQSLGPVKAHLLIGTWEGDAQTFTTMGEVTGVIGVPLNSWRSLLHHPVLYARTLGRKIGTSWRGNG